MVGSVALGSGTGDGRWVVVPLDERAQVRYLGSIGGLVVIVLVGAVGHRGLGVRYVDPVSAVDADDMITRCSAVMTPDGTPCTRC
jgi:hypothetical protein